MRAIRAAVVLLLLLSFTPSAQAATGTYIRLAQLSPDFGKADLTITAAGAGAPLATDAGAGYGSLLAYRRVDPGTYTVAIRPAGADLGTAPLATATVQAADGKAYTVAALAKALKVLDDDISLPPAGQARIRVINAAPSVSQLDLIRGGTAVVQRAAYAEPTLYRAIEPGSTTMQVVPRGAAPVDLKLTVEAGGVYTVFVLESGGKITATARADAKGAQVVPGGGQETGFGWLAGVRSRDYFPLVALTACACCVGVLLSRRRRTG